MRGPVIFSLVTAPHEFRLIADSAPVPMWLTGLDRKRRFVNRAYVEFVGLGYEQALGFDWRTILHPDDHDRIVAESIAGEASLKPFALEARYQIGGQTRWLHSVSQPLLDEDGTHLGFIGVAFDLTEAKEAERHLREAEAGLRLATEGSGTGTWQWDLVERSAAWSEETRRIIGVGADEVVTVDQYAAIIHPGDVAMVLERVNAAVRANRDFAIEYRVVRPDGAVRWVLSRGVGIRNPDGRAVRTVGTINDITDRKAAEEQLREAEERLRLATESAGIGTWDWDLTRVRGTWSPATQRILGVDRGDEITLEERYRTIHPDDLAAVKEAIRAAVTSGTDFAMEYRVVRPTGEVRWISSRGTMKRDGDGKVVRTLGTVQDITDRREARAKLEQLNRRLEMVVAERTAERDGMWRLSRDLLIVLDPRLRILSVNPVIEELTGFAPDEVLGRRLKGFIHPDDWENVLDAIRTGRRALVRDAEARLVTKDGEVRCFVWNATPEAGRAYVSGRDVTDERARLDELLSAQEALRQSQKLEAIGQLTGGVAHDFNNLLSPIIGGLDLLRRRGVGGEREQALIEGALQSADRARLLVQRLLAFARRQPLQVRAVALAPVLDEISGLLASTLGPQTALSIDVASGLDPVLADPNQLEMAILNLTVNARDAMPGGGTLRIAARPGEDTEDGSRFVEIAVADNGLGMDEATLARAAEPFFSSKGVGKGTGLGLSMVEGLTAQLGGTMRIASRIGEGTTVTLRLPATARLPEAASGTPLAALASGTRGRVLLIDDEPLVRMGTAEALRDCGFEVVEAASGEEALALADDAGKFACVVTDYLMPGIDGVELARRLRRREPTLPIMLLSGYAELDAFGSELPYLGKPALADELTRMIAGLIDRGIDPGETA
ncbi:MAG TPA: PAS domain-containing protein [Novosphingobium sp.]|nr:PAS domain-containing protein [Novosphingobium sp.]